MTKSKGEPQELKIRLHYKIPQVFFILEHSKSGKRMRFPNAFKYLPLSVGQILFEV